MIDKWFHEKNTNVTEIKEDNVDGHIKGTNLTDVERRSYVDRYGRMDKRQMKTVLRSASCRKKVFQQKKFAAKLFFLIIEMTVTQTKNLFLSKTST